MNLKVQTHALITAAVVTSLLVACAPDKKGTRFADRGSQKVDSDPRDLQTMTGKADVTSDANVAFAEQIVKVDVQVKKARNSNGEELLNELLEKVFDGEVPAYEEEQVAATATPAPSASPSIGTENAAGERRGAAREYNYMISAKINLANVGEVEFVGIATSTSERQGAEALKRLTPILKDCEEKLKDLRVRASCKDSSCSKLAVLIENRSTSSEQAYAQFLLKRDGHAVPQDDIEQLKFVAEDRTAELVARGITPQGKATCKKGSTVANDNERNANDNAPATTVAPAPAATPAAGGQRAASETDAGIAELANLE